MGTASARPENLQGFVDSASELRRELSTRISVLRASYDRFQLSGSSYVGNSDLMAVALPGLLTTYQNDEQFVAVVRQAFVDAAGSGSSDGRVVVDAAAFSAAFDAAATAAGFDPQALLAGREPVTVDVPVAAGTPATSGFVADPVCTATGHFVEVEDDFTWPDRLEVLRWRRTYSSRFVAGGPFGRGWASWASVALVADRSDGTVGYHGPDGQMAVFTPAAGGVGYRRVPGVGADLVTAEGGGWLLSWDVASARRGEEWRFDAGGRLASVRGPASGTVTFGYAAGLLVSLVHEGGRRLDLEWEGPRIVAVRGSCGRVARYRYDDEGDLVAVERVLGDRRYVTDDAGLVVEVWDADGVRLCRNVYDGEGRVLSQVSPFGRETRFAYQPGRRTVVSDTTDGPVSIFEHDPAGRLVGLVDHLGHRMERSFDADGRCVAATGFAGSRTVQSFEADGRSATRRGPGGVEERWDYDDAGRVAGHEVVGGARLDLDYEGDGPVPTRIAGPDGWEIGIEAAGGMVTALTDADGVSVHIDYDADGNVVSVANVLGAVTVTEPHVSGLAARVIYPDGAVYEIDRDDAGRMRGLRAPLGDEYRLEWSAAGRLSAMVGPDGSRTRFEHGTHGAVERVIDALGAELTLSHDHLERLVGITAPGGAKWEFSYTGLGLLALVHDPAGGTWGYDYDAEGRMVAATNPSGHETRWRHSPAGRLSEVVDPMGNATRYTRDALGRVIATEAPEGATTAYDWDVWGRPTRMRFPDGDVLVYAYTPAGRVRQVTTAEGRSWTNEYDEAGRLVSVTDGSGAATRFEWDVCDRLVATVTPEGHTTRIAYDAGGRVVATTSGGRTWRTGYDPAGRPTTVTDPLGATTRYRYDAVGRLVAATDPLGNTMRVRYDDRGNPVAIVDPFGGVTTTTYDPMRRPVAVTDPLGRTTHIHRDAVGRIVRREAPTGDVVEWRRDARGLATGVRVNGRDTIVFDRDRAGRPVLVLEPARNRTFTLGWSPGGRLRALDVDGATMRWDRDRDGLVTARHDPAGRTTDYERDATGRLAAVASDRWGRVELDRDRDGRLVALRAPGVTRTWRRDTAGVVAGYHELSPVGETTTRLVRDGAGRVIEAHDADGSVARYRYDPAGQLVAATTPAGAWTWAYDQAGRLTREEGPDGVTGYDYDAAHQLVRISGPAGITAIGYDAAGRRTQEVGPAGTRRYRWDGIGRLQAIEQDGRERPVDVDALGNLAAVGGTTLTWDPAGPVAEPIAVGADEVVSAAGHTLALAAPDGAVRWLGADWRHNTTASLPGAAGDTGAAGAPAGAGGGTGNHLDPWGASSVPSSGVPAPGAFGEVDLGGLTWLRNRVYDPVSRAFLAPDPLPGVPGTPFATHPYHYAGNDPVGHVDPLGLQPLSLDQYELIREQETAVQKQKLGTLAMGALLVGSFFIPGGPIIATLVGAGLGMAPGIITGITTGEWDAGAIVKGAVVGAVAGRVGFAFGAGGGTLAGAMARGGAGGAATGAIGEGYDLLPLPGSDGQFNVETVALDTVIGTATGGMAHRLAGPTTPSSVEQTADVAQSARNLADTYPRPPREGDPRTVAVLETPSHGLYPGRSGFSEPNHPEVQHALDNVPNGSRSPFHGRCAEIDCLNQSYTAGDIPSGGALGTARVRGPNSAAHGTPIEPCASCADVLQQLGVAWSGG